MNRISGFTAILIFLTIWGSPHCSAQQADPEFPPGFVMYAKLHSGMITNFSSAPDLFTGGVQLFPQVTVLPGLLRAGIIAGAFYNNNHIGGEFGPGVSIKLKTFYAKLKGAQVGSVGNVNLFADHLWGTGKQKLTGITGSGTGGFNRRSGSGSPKRKKIPSSKRPINEKSTCHQRRRFQRSFCRRGFTGIISYLSVARFRHLCWYKHRLPGSISGCRS